jgi:hypothetical protein
VIGAALASVLTVTGNAVYSHSIRRTGERVRTVVPVAARFAPRPMPVAEPAPDSSTRPARGWPVLAAACLGVFAAVLFVVTAFELVEGRPLSDVVRGTSGSGTSVLGDAGRASHVPARPAPTVTVTVTPKVVTTTPTVTVTGTPATKTVDPTPTSTPTPTPTPSVSPSGSTSGSDASGGSSP